MRSLPNTLHDVAHTGAPFPAETKAALARKQSAIYIENPNHQFEMRDSWPFSTRTMANWEESSSNANDRSMRSKRAKKSSHEIGSSSGVPDTASPKRKRSRAGSPSNFRRFTSAGTAPCLSAQRRISSWSRVGCKIRASPAEGRASGVGFAVVLNTAYLNQGIGGSRSPHPTSMRPAISVTTPADRLSNEPFLKMSDFAFVNSRARWVADQVPALPCEGLRA